MLKDLNDKEKTLKAYVEGHKEHLSSLFQYDNIQKSNILIILNFEWFDKYVVSLNPF